MPTCNGCKQAAARISCPRMSTPAHAGVQSERSARLHEQVRQAGEQALVGVLGGAVGRRVLEHARAEGRAEVECLQHAVRVARVAEVLQPEVALALCGAAGGA